MKPTTETEHLRDLTMFWLESCPFNNRWEGQARLGSLLRSFSGKTTEIPVSTSTRHGEAALWKSVENFPKRSKKKSILTSANDYCLKKNRQYPLYTASLIWTPVEPANPPGMDYWA